MPEPTTLTGPAANKPAKKSNRFMLAWPDKYADTLAAILKDAENDDREPGEYLVRWLSENYAGSESAPTK